MRPKTRTSLRCWSPSTAASLILSKRGISMHSGFPTPVAVRRPEEFTLHGTTLVDDYAWLKAENWQDVLQDPNLLDPAIKAHLDAENVYFDNALSGTKGLQSRLVAEMRGRIWEDDAGVPTPEGPYAYVHRYREGGQHQLIGRTPRDGGDFRIVLDGDEIAKGSEYFLFGETRNSPDHKLEAWSADTAGSEYYTIRVRDWETAKDLPDLVEGTDGGIVWSADSKSFFYVKFDENHRPMQVYRHLLGTPQSSDLLVYEEKDIGWFTIIHESSSGRFCVIAGGDHETSEQHLIDLINTDSRPILVAEREPGVMYSVEDRGDQLYILTNADEAIDFKIVTAPLATPSRDHWKDLIPHRPGAYITECELYANHLVRLECSDAIPAIVVRDLTTNAEHAIAFDEATYALEAIGGYEFDTTTLRFSYSSMTTPREVYAYDMATRARALLKRQEIPSGHDPERYVTTRIDALALDGAQIPVSILHRKGFVPDGNAPLLLYGYGSYGDSMFAEFSADRFSLVDRGFVYAIAHVRGGADKGRRWYHDGKREKKTNTFDDFAACANALIKSGYTSKKQIVALGRSAGGMLMGAVANRSGDLFAGIIAEVPFVDVLNTMRDDTLPLTPPEWPEWGNPTIDANAFRNILEYSPYENVAAQDYPAILAVAGLTDPRVTYWEPAKWIARLRATMTGGGPVFLHTNMGAGHGGASGRFDHLEETARTYAFALWAVGMADDDTLEG